MNHANISWTPVDEDKPKHKQTCLVSCAYEDCAERDIFIAWYSETYDCFIDSSAVLDINDPTEREENDITGVTAWSPRPAPYDSKNVVVNHDYEVMQKLNGLKLHETLNLGSDGDVMKVPGGWLYRCSFYNHHGDCVNVAQTFVPEPEEI